MSRRNAFTFLEVLFTLGLLMVGLGSIVLLQADSIGRDARTVSRFLVSHRLRAVVSGEPAVPFGVPCSVQHQWGETGLPRSLLAVPPRGLQFTTDGLPRTCDGGGVGNTTILLEHRGRQAAVIVSSLGRVRWEMR